MASRLTRCDPTLSSRSGDHPQPRRYRPPRSPRGPRHEKYEKEPRTPDSFPFPTPVPVLGPQSRARPRSGTSPRPTCISSRKGPTPSFTPDLPLSVSTRHPYHSPRPNPDCLLPKIPVEREVGVFLPVSCLPRTQPETYGPRSPQRVLGPQTWDPFVLVSLVVPVGRRGKGRGKM